VDVDNRTLLYFGNLHSKDLVGHIFPSHYGDKVAEMDNIHSDDNFYGIRHCVFLLQRLPMRLLHKHMGILRTKNYYGTLR
jgi:hypothetical protein